MELRRLHWRLMTDVMRYTYETIRHGRYTHLASPHSQDYPERRIGNGSCKPETESGDTTRNQEGLGNSCPHIWYLDPKILLLPSQCGWYAPSPWRKPQKPAIFLFHRLDYIHIRLLFRADNSTLVITLFSANVLIAVPLTVSVRFL